MLFGSVGLLFLLVSLLLGRLLRPAVPTATKLDVYECGEPAVGSSFVQFDLRFYVVALVFIVFEVEVALFFPPATIFGTATRWMKPQTPPRFRQTGHRAWGDGGEEIGDPAGCGKGRAQEQGRSGRGRSEREGLSRPKTPARWPLPRPPIWPRFSL